METLWLYFFRGPGVLRGSVFRTEPEELVRLPDRLFKELFGNAELREIDRFDDGRTLLLGVVVRVLGELDLGALVRVGVAGNGPTMRFVEERVPVGRGLGGGVLDLRGGATRVEVPREDFGRVRAGLVLMDGEGTVRLGEVARRAVGVDLLVIGEVDLGEKEIFGVAGAGVRFGLT